MMRPLARGAELTGEGARRSMTLQPKQRWIRNDEESRPE
jgi:hypothetical protein